MKILVICQHYWPEPYPLTDICEKLIQRGHIVHVITDVPNYPMGITYPNYTCHKRRQEEHNGVKITRTFTIARKHNVLFRLLNYYSYALSSTLYVKKMQEEYNVVFANQTSPVIMSTAAFAYAKKHTKKVVMYCMDLWPASLAAGGLNENSLIYRFFNKVSRKLYHKANRILISSQMFRDYLVEQHGVDSDKISYLPQYANACFDEIRKVTCKKDTIDLVFAGNIGIAQSIPTIIHAAEILKKQSTLLWHIVGDGSELESMRALAKSKKLSNVIFHGRKAPEDMPHYYTIADAMLVTLIADPFISLTLPGKVQTYMAAGKPIIGAANGEICKVIKDAQCGFCANAEDAKGLVKAVQQFIAIKNKNKLSENASHHYQRNFSQEMFINTLEQELMRCDNV